MRKFFDWLNRNVFVKNLILAACAIIILVFVVNILLNLFTRHNVHEVVPDFRNMTMEQAHAAARKGNLKIEINDSIFKQHHPPGVILHQMPDPGTEVKSGRRILVTTNAFNRRMVPIPYVTGVSLRQAKNNLEVAGFEIAKLIYQTDIATNYVLETRYGKITIHENVETKAEQGSGITLVVGVNPDEATVIVPKVVGLPYPQAKSRLWEMGLNLGKSGFADGINPDERDAAHVWKQNPAYGSRVSLGSSVSLDMTLDDDKIKAGSADAEKEALRLLELRRAEEEGAEEGSVKGAEFMVDDEGSSGEEGDNTQTESL